MVLQHGGSGASVWGFGTAGDTVKVTVDADSKAEPSNRATLTATVKDNGIWKVVLPAQPPTLAGSFSVSATSSSGEQAKLADVVFGDVWVCSGQSNMDHPLTSVINAAAEVEAANAVGAAVRLLKVKKIASADATVEDADLPGLETRWSYARNVTAANFSATCWLTGSMLQQHLGIVVGLVDSSWAGVGIPTLSSRASAALCGVDATRGCPGTSSAPEPQNATAVYNTMIAPLHATTIKGVLWWQGEASGPGCANEIVNSTKATYYCLWQALIADWRTRWHTQSGTPMNLPFGFVQLEPTANPSIRWDETAHRISTPNACLDNVFMAAALDFGDTVAGVHTRYKRPISARLALAARAVAYNETDVYYTGPIAHLATVSADNRTVTLKFVGVESGGIEVRSPAGFSVCGAKRQADCYKWSNDGLFVNATARPGAVPDEVVLDVPPGMNAVGGIGVVRYEWAALPCNWPELEKCAIYSNDLPAPPFMIGVGVASPLQPPPCIDVTPLSPSLLPSYRSASWRKPQRQRVPRRFVHPGAFLGVKQLAYVRSQAQVGGSVVNKTLQKMLSFTYMNGRNSTSMSRDWNGTISCGYFGSHDYGCRNESSDAVAVEIQAMLWAVTGDEKWATRAISIMNFYSKHLKEYANWGNGKLEAAWAACKWGRAAELLSATGAPWDPADVDAFKRLLLHVSVPMLYNGSCFNGNWELAMIEGMSSIAVFTENTTLWDHALSMWHDRVPAYFYMSTDGPHPKVVSRCERAFWYNQVTFNASVNGVCQETCRDFGHTSYGLASTFNVAETALLQGVDLYTENANRLQAALEFHTTFLNEGGYPPSGSAYKPSVHNVTNRFVCNGTQLHLSYAATYQVGLTGLQRLGRLAELPQTTRYVRDWVWNLSAGDSCPPFMYCFEALTHSAPAPTL